MAAMALLLPAAAAALAAVHLPQHPLPPIPSSPSCMLNGEPCPLPQWEPDWSTINSTALMSTDPAGFAPKHRWGWVTLDWQCGVKTWLGTTPKQCTCEATSAAACAALKAAGKVKRCSIYHNMELSLEWIESERAVMDAAHVEAGWFLRFPNGSAFSHPRFYRPGVGPLLQQWFIDWRSAAATEYFVSAIVNSTLADGVDGTFTDDRTGVPAEHPEVGPTLNLTELELQDIQHATQAAGQKLASALAAANRTCWDCVGGCEGAPGSNWGRNQRPAPKGRAACAAHMRKLCAPQMQERGMFMSWDTGWNETSPDNTSAILYHNQTLASFLITRPPIAFIGGAYGVRDNAAADNWDPLFALDVGLPLALCSEGPTDVFSRRWSKGTAKLDCRQGSSVFTEASSGLPGQPVTYCGQNIVELS